MKLAVVDYGAGNLASVLKAFRAAGAAPFIARTPDDIREAAAVVIPGVGHFAATRGIDAVMRRALQTSRAPLLGICLGMHVLYAGSDEAPDVPGLGLIDGRVTRIRNGGALKVPHVGWNTLEQRRPSPLVSGTRTGDAVYFTHSYAAPDGPDAVAVTDYGGPFASIVSRGRVSGMQFHPEKSGQAGLGLLKNWVAQCSANA